MAITKKETNTAHRSISSRLSGSILILCLSLTRVLDTSGWWGSALQGLCAVQTGRAKALIPPFAEHPQEERSQHRTYNAMAEAAKDVNGALADARVPDVCMHACVRRRSVDLL